MPQPKLSPAEMSMPTFATLEEWTRSQVQELMQSVLEEKSRTYWDGRATNVRHRWTHPAATAMDTESRVSCRSRPARSR